MRLIDADELDNVVIRLNDQDWQITRGEYKLMDRVLFEFPSVDAIPVRHGEWIQTDKAPYEYECSECGYGFTDVKLSYCYDCGSKMDLIGEEEK